MNIYLQSSCFGHHYGDRRNLCYWGLSTSSGFLVLVLTIVGVGVGVGVDVDVDVGVGVGVS